MRYCKNTYLSVSTNINDIRASGQNHCTTIKFATAKAVHGMTSHVCLQLQPGGIPFFPPLFFGLLSSWIAVYGPFCWIEWETKLYPPKVINLHCVVQRTINTCSLHNRQKPITLSKLKVAGLVSSCDLDRRKALLRAWKATWAHSCNQEDNCRLLVSRN